MITTFGKRPGDKVRFLVPNGIGRDGVEYKTVTGRVVMVFNTHLVVNLGGRYGRPGVVTPENFVS